MNNIILSSVRMTCAGLSDMELAAINNAAQADFDPTQIPCYSKVSHLFTLNGGKIMHEEVKNALARATLERLAAVKLSYGYSTDGLSRYGRNERLTPYSE